MEQASRDEALSHVFDEFAQETDVPRGRGPGLYVVRHRVELHKGSVEVESGGRGLGARFVGTLAGLTADAA